VLRAIGAVVENDDDFIADAVNRHEASDDEYLLVAAANKRAESKRTGA
jgi:hypothetical protein